MSNRMSAFIREPAHVAAPLAPYVSPFAKDADSGGNDDDDDADDDDDDADDDDDDDPDEDKTDAELRAELKATRESLAKASNQSAKRRKLIREREAAHRAELERRKPKPAGKSKDDGGETPDLDEIRAEARRDGESAGLTRAKKSEAKAELLAAGVSRDRVDRAIGLIKLDDLDLDDDGLDGIDDEIVALRKSWPELFKTTRQRRGSVAGEGDRDGKERRPKPKTASEQAAARVLGR